MEYETCTQNETSGEWMCHQGDWSHGPYDTCEERGDWCSHVPEKAYMRRGITTQMNAKSMKEVTTAPDLAKYIGKK